jgi:ABC-type glycerol-3-phosphate transport system substrate-binding protein
MAVLEFITGTYNQDAVHKLQQIFTAFEQDGCGSVSNTRYSWDDLWRQLLHTAIYQPETDLAEVGTTWLDSLMAMNALRPFSRNDLLSIGDRDVFIPSAWQSAMFAGMQEVWAIPYRVDVRVVYYWRDLLEAVGVDPLTAFSTPAAFHSTLAALQKIMPTPLCLSTDRSDHDCLHDSASFVWASGGDYVSPDGRRVLFDQPSTLDALTEYFQLYRYMPPLRMRGSDEIRLFFERKVAVTILGPWLPARLKEAQRFDLLPRLGIASPPGPAFVGGSLLVIWEHSRNARKAVDLISRLVSPQVQAELCPLTGELPARLEPWQLPAFRENPLISAFYEPLLNGRSLTRVPIWQMIEEKLSFEMGLIWEELFASPGPDVANIVRRHLLPQARRMNITLGS